MADDLTSSIAFCWRLERTDGAGIGLTSHDESLLSEGAAFEPAPGMTPAAVTRRLGLEAHSGEVAGTLDSQALDETDLVCGRWDGATVELTAVDWQDRAVPPVRLIGGELATVGSDGRSFTAELRGATARLQGPVCPATSAECRAEFGDKSCRVDLASRTVRATVIAIAGTRLSLDGPVDDRFVLGRLRYLSGGNCGRTTVVLAVDGAEVQLRDVPRLAIEPGCVVELREGCDKRLETCTTRFANAANFRGEPHLPGTDLLTRYPGA